jgi:glycosyltransferase involved in cell wall biosynthesis
MLLSIVICTYNRAELLEIVLASLAEQADSSPLYEILVIDNGSTDHTRQVVERAMARAKVRYVLETTVGLSHARNRGWREAQGEYVAYIDDDCKVPPQWATIAAEIIREKRPSIFGGPSGAFYITPKPRWFRDEYSAFGFGDRPRRLNETEHLMGNNIVFRRELFSLIGGLDVDLGMNGQTVAYGEETELQMRVRRMIPAAEVYYDPRLFVYHLVRPEKMTLGWRIRSAFAIGRTSYMLAEQRSAGKVYQAMQLIGGVVRNSLLLARVVVYGLAQRDRVRFPYLANCLYENRGPWTDLGRCYEQFRQEFLNLR